MSIIWAPRCLQMKKILNYKVVDRIEIYNVCIKFISIRVHINYLWFFESELPRSKEIPPDEPAITPLQYPYRQFIRWYVFAASWTGDRRPDLQKKLRHIFLKNQKLNNIKIKKSLWSPLKERERKSAFARPPTADTCYYIVIICLFKVYCLFVCR